MNALSRLASSHPIAEAMLVVCLVAAFGLFLGGLRLRGVRLGIAGVLFSGLLFGHLGITLSPELLEFLREFGLILFVYTIGMQVGPGFFSSLRKDGLRLNALAVSVVILGLAAAWLASRFCGIDAAAGVGMYSGAVTNTPSLAAAQQALKDLPGVTEEMVKRPGIGYAVAYPFGILGTILAMVALRLAFRIDPEAEARGSEEPGRSGLITRSIKVENKNLHGLPLDKLPALHSLGVRVSRLMHEGVVRVPTAEDTVALGDVLLAVGRKESLDELTLVVGGPSELDLKSLPSKVSTRRLIVTRKDVLGMTAGELDLENRYGVTLTRAARADIDFLVTPDYTLQFGDSLLAVGEEDVLGKVAALVGDSPASLTHPQLIPVFVGIALGVALGQVPVHLPGMPAPVRLGLAGGPLLAAIVLSKVRRIGPLSWYMPISANFMLRELGIILFLACVGLRAGDRFADTLLHGDGLRWALCGAAVTLVPLLLVGFAARSRWKLNYLTLCGVLAGSMTDPPALSFANSLAASSGPSIAYATVYPLVMILRVVSAQIFVFLAPL